MNRKSKMYRYIWVLLVGLLVPGFAFSQEYCVAGDPPAKIEYPIAALEHRSTGLAVVQTQLDDDGMPSSVQLIRSSGYEVLDSAALDAAKKDAIYCTAGYAGDQYIDAFAFDLDYKRANKRVIGKAEVTRVIEPLAVATANLNRLFNQCLFEQDDRNFIYPRDAIAGHVEGTVMLEVTRDPANQRRQVAIVDSSGDTRLDTVATNIAHNAKMTCGSNAPLSFRIPIRFLMDKGGISTKEGAGANRITNYGVIIKPGHLIWSKMDQANGSR